MFHHRPTLKQSNKSHKSGRHDTKGETKKKIKGRVEKGEHHPSVFQLSKRGKHHKDARVNRAKQIQLQKRAHVLQSKRQGLGPPRCVAIFGLAEDANAELAYTLLLNECGLDTLNVPDRPTTVILGPLKQRATLLTCRRDVLSILDAAKVADVVAVVMRADANAAGGVVLDDVSALLVSVLRAQGMPSIVGLLQGLEDVPVKKRNDVRRAYTQFLDENFPDSPKLFELDVPDHAPHVIRHVAAQRLRAIAWRDQRPHMLAESVSFRPSEDSKERGTLLVTGYIRGMSLSASQLVHLPGVGTFQIAQIDGPEDPCPAPRSGASCPSSRRASVSTAASSKMEGADEVDADMHDAAVPRILDRPDPDAQESLVSEVEPDPMTGEQTWPTDDEIKRAAIGRKKVLRKVAKGTSEYQAAWIPDTGDGEDVEVPAPDDDDDNEDEHDVEDDEAMAEGPERAESNGIDEEEDGMEEDENKEEDADADEDDEDEEDGEGGVETDEERNKREDERQRVLTEYQESRDYQQYPDEVEVPLDKPARERFARYRGLKSLRTSTWSGSVSDSSRSAKQWDVNENLPRDYARIFRFENLKGAQHHAMKHAQLGVEAGTFVCVHVANFPASALDRVEVRKGPVVLGGLFMHENKMSVMHWKASRHSTFSEPFRSKTVIELHCGIRRFSASVLVSEYAVGRNQFRLHRFLPDGSDAMVFSAFAPVTFPPAPCIMFLLDPDGTRKLLATGSVLGADPDRVILKKIVLCGFPARVRRTHAVVRFMFHNPDDIRWFKPVDLWTKHGRVGHIREPLGTHGYMKCRFNGPMRNDDTVCMTLYKRSYPRWPSAPI